MLDDIILTTEIQYFVCDSGHGGNIINDCINALKEDSPGYSEMEFEYRWNKLEHIFLCRMWLKIVDFLYF